MAGVDPDRWQRLSPYLDRALDLADEGERAAWLATIAEQDPRLAAELAALLQEHRALREERFLDHPAVPRPALETVPGAPIGAYTLISPIGQGGMGTVWLAERSDDRFERRAAIKFLNVALTGRGDDRFKREGRILARLAHPHIAKLIDAGVSATGRPYLILEHVDGQPIDRYCDHHGLDVDARLRLFLDVLGAVAHAHANLIVHRDLKPSNVLVGSEGGVKLLDFGIAKLLEDEGQTGAATILTREGGGALTPEFAAPEQVTGEPVSTATDVYALGVLLYVLLTGQHPAGSGPRSPADLIKAIVDREPPRMSDVVVRSGTDAAALAADARNRGTTPDKLRRRLRGDLETILAKALKKKPSERYVSVTAMGDDIRRYLRHEPISARPDTLAYRATKFARRNRLTVAATTLTLASLSVGLYVANHERIIAERRFSQLRQLSTRVFDLDHVIRNLSGSTEARHRLVATSLECLEGLGSEASGDLDLAQELGDGYWRLARVQGVPTEANLGDFTKAEESLRKADAFIETVLTSRPGDRSALYRSAYIAQDRMILAESERRREDALAHARKAAERMDAFLRRGDAKESERADAAVCYGNLALAHINMHFVRGGCALCPPLRGDRANPCLPWIPA